MSLRTTSGIIAVDKDTKEVIWKLKYPNVSHNNIEPVMTDSVLCFDNGNIRPSSIHHSRIVEFDYRKRTDEGNGNTKIDASCIFLLHMGGLCQEIDGTTTRSFVNIAAVSVDCLKSHHREKCLGIRDTRFW